MSAVNAGVATETTTRVNIALEVLTNSMLKVRASTCRC